MNYRLNSKRINRNIKIIVMLTIALVNIAALRKDIYAVDDLTYASRIQLGDKELAQVARKSPDKCARIEDGKGGSAFYDMETNTLTLDNFTLIASENQRFLADISYMHGLTVKLIGQNHMYGLNLSDDVSYAMYFQGGDANDVTIIGPGSIDFVGSAEFVDNLTVRDCTMSIKSSRYGLIVADNAEIYNSYIEVIIDNPTPEGYEAAMTFDKLKVRDSILRSTSAPGHEAGEGISAYVPRALITEYENGPVDLGADMTITDADGNQMIGRKMRDIHRQFRLVYSAEGKWKNVHEGGIDQDFGIIKENALNVTETIVIKSINKESSMKVESRIGKLADLDLNSDAYGKELLACEEDLKNLSEEARKLVANQLQLQEAREGYEENNQKKAQEVETRINEIGEVTEKSQAKIEEAQKAYEKLTQDQKDRVGNAELLISASEKYREIIEQKRIREEKEAAIKKDKEASEQKYKEETKDPVKGDTDSGDPNETISSKIKKNKITYIKSKKKKQVTLKWKKDKTCKGYQISYSTDKKFKKNTKTKTIKKYRTTKVTITKLKSRKTYYIRIREYQLDGKKKVYGAWSAVKKIKVK